MRRESIIIFTLSALISVGMVGALSHFHYKSGLVQNQSPEPAVKEQPSRADLDKQPIAVAPPKEKKAPTDTRLNYPQKCIGANGEVIFTDQRDCANAAPTSTLSVVDSVAAQPRQTQVQKQTSANTQKSNVGKQSKKPSLPLGTALSPRDVPRECKFPLGKALEIERSLSATKDPAESIWKESYCKWIREARQDGCEVTREHFHYLDICPRW